MIRSVYEYVFVHCYIWSRRVYGDDYYNVYSASLMLTLLMVINVGSIVGFMSLITEMSFLDSNWSLVFFLGLIAIAIFSNFRYFSDNNRYLKVLEAHESKRPIGQTNGLVIGGLVIGSLLLLFVSWFIALMKHS